MTTKKTETNVQTVDIDIDEIIGMPGGESIMTPDEKKEETPKHRIFESPDPDMTFLDKPEPTKETPEEETPEEKTARLEAERAAQEKLDAETPEEKEARIAEERKDPLDIENQFEEEEDDKNKGGRPTGLVSVAKKLIDKGLLLPFEDDKKIEDYTQEDFEELLELNFQSQQDKLNEELPAKFFGNMPLEMQQAYQYIAEGGTDVKGMFQALATSVETKQIDITKEEGQKQAIRSYLSATQWGTPEEIEDEVFSLEDKGDLEKKAKQFKPKLDAMSQQIVDREIAQQTAAKQQRAKQSQMYMDSVYNTLEKTELNGLKLDNKTQNMLYAGLTQTNYPSVSGKQTNMLGHLLEKYQWVEPDHGLIAEALWLLADPETYRKQIASTTEKEVTQKTMRTLKTEQQSKSGTGQVVEEKETLGSGKKRPGLQRPKKNFFAR